MSNQDEQSAQSLIRAPTYNELFDQAEALRLQLEALKKDLLKVETKPPQNKPALPACNDYRLLPDLNRTVPIFTGHESSSTAEDWIGTVDALARINNWPVPYRLQYAKSNMTKRTS